MKDQRRSIAAKFQSTLYLTRFHGVFTPNSKYRPMMTPSKRGMNTHRQINGDQRSPAERHAAVSWAQRLKRVFNIDISICQKTYDN
ncbi:MAG: hypothetical protein OER87_13230 [Gammaproteobacteria bacterium]|nr:hypothetical protein [Gammaproteobacteria bacterium]